MRPVPALLRAAALASLLSVGPAGAAPVLPATLSSAVVPLHLPLSALQAAAERQAPTLLSHIDQDQVLLGGLLVVHLAGDVERSGPLVLTPEGSSLRVELPVTARIRATPAGIGAFLARDVAGSAVVTLRLTPHLSADWQLQLPVQADYHWTDPIRLELAQGVNLDVQGLVDPQIRAQLNGIAAQIGAAASAGLDLPGHARQFWTQLAQPWTLPAAQLGAPAYARVVPKGLLVSALNFGPEQLSLTLAASFAATAGLGTPPPSTVPELPPLQTGTPTVQGVHLNLPLSLPYPELSQLATRYAGRQDFPLPLPLRPRLQVRRVTLTPQGQRLQAAVEVRLTALGVPVTATLDVTGTPRLSGTVLTLEGVTVRTRPSGLTQRVLGWLADARVQRLVAQQARADLAPLLTRARQDVQARLPYAPAPGVQLGGALTGLRLQQLTVQPQALLVGVEAAGELSVQVSLR
ncbi:DUF4403 family protein [Deinococcus sonorensis]|uniref:DUF4403 family protein n=2 Tax=Deinococcus sonorensis TaxID=309891 RepID=A0AAU7U8T7_9DEIO